MGNLTEAEEEIVGKKLVKILMLRKDITNKDRYTTTWGNKTALGIYRLVSRVVTKS